MPVPEKMGQMTFIGKPEFGRDLLQRELSAGNPFFNQFGAVTVDVFAVTDIKISFEIGTEIIGGNIKMCGDVFYRRGSYTPQCFRWYCAGWFCRAHPVSVSLLSTTYTAS
jgi:hypothetical protein